MNWVNKYAKHIHTRAELFSMKDMLHYNLIFNSVVLPYLFAFIFDYKSFGEGPGPFVFVPV